jgi:hypothetical protein
MLCGTTNGKENKSYQMQKTSTAFEFLLIKAATESSQGGLQFTRLRYILNNSHKIFVINTFKG